MSDRDLTAAELDELERVTEAATPGPWAKSPNAVDAVIAPEQPGKCAFPESDAFYGGFLVGESMDYRDRDFLIAARDAMPRIIAEIRRLRLRALKDR